MTDETLQLTLKLEGGPEATDEDVAGLARRLRDDLLELDVEGVKPGEKEAPPGSKTGPVMDWTTLFVTLAASGGVLTVLITAIQNWLMRNQASSLTIKLGDDELTLSGPGPYSEEQKRVLAVWERRYKGFVLPGEGASL